MRLPFALFLLLNLLGSFLYYGLVVLLGALFHRAIADVLHTMETFGTISIVALIAAFAALHSVPLVGPGHLHPPAAGWTASPSRN